MSTAPKPPPSPARLLRSINSLCELLALNEPPATGESNNYASRVRVRAY